MRVLDGIKIKRSTIFEECSGAIGPRSSPCEIAWRLNHVHSKKRKDVIVVTCFKIFMLETPATYFKFTKTYQVNLRRGTRKVGEQERNRRKNEGEKAREKT